MKIEECWNCRRCAYLHETGLCSRCSVVGSSSGAADLVLLSIVIAAALIIGLVMTYPF